MGRLVWPLVLCLALVAGAVGAAEYTVLRRVETGAITVDGHLSDWTGGPGRLVLDGPAHVTYRAPGNAAAWSGPADHGAVVSLAWCDGGIYLAAEVTDDAIRQPYRGREVWKGDYVNLWIDTTPVADLEREELGQGQYHIGLHPGNFAGRAGGDGVIPPSIFFFQPQNLPLVDGAVQARLSASGWTLEAFLPWAAVGMTAPAAGAYLALEVAVSDGDQDPPMQESILTLGTAAWTLKRWRLLPALLGDAGGHAETPETERPLAEEIVFAEPGSRTLSVSVDAIPAGHLALLAVKARSQFERPAGYCMRSVRIEVNGTTLSSERLVNRPATMTIGQSNTMPVVGPDGTLTPPHEPAFGAADRDRAYGVPGQRVSDFVFNLEGLLRTGANTVVVHGTQRQWQGTYPTMVVGEVRLQTRPARAGEMVFRPAPTGPLPIRTPAVAFPRTVDGLDWQESDLALRVNGRTVRIESRFSAPGGTWHRTSTPALGHERRVDAHDGWVVVTDTFTNLTAGDLPVIHEHMLRLGDDTAHAWLAGLPVDPTNAHVTGGANPSVFVSTADGAGLGLAALADIFRVHLAASVVRGDAALSDRSLLLAPGARVTAEWAVVPVRDGDFWTFVNTARRMMRMNFVLPYTFASAMTRAPVYDWSDERFRDYVRHKGADFIVQSNDVVRTAAGHPARCTDWLAGPHDVYRDMQTKIRRLYPDGSVRHAVYFHCYLDTTLANRTRFAADMGRDVAGEAIPYGRHTYMHLFIPTLENGWGREISRVIDVILEDIQADGIFWDEFAYGVQPFAFVYGRWDGVSADIDPKTFETTRKKASTALLSRDFRVHHVKRIQARGAPLVINGAPQTRTLADLHIPAFTETANIMNCRSMLLHSPIALGDHLTERTHLESYRVMRQALSHGCLYAWYNTRIFPDYPMLPEHMFPFTPVELHAGWVVGVERIITAESGLFGWNDRSGFTGSVYDREGRPTTSHPVERVEQDGKVYAAVRLPSGYTAALVRQAAPAE